MPRHAPRKELPREVQISKALSNILRHAAEREGVHMDSRGYANVADLLAWRRLRGMKVTFPEILDAVSTSDKQRFALLHKPPTSSTPSSTDEPTTQSDETPTSEETPTPPAAETETAKALSAKDPEPSHYLIRATQGHSLKLVDAESLLQKLSLSEDTQTALPTTVVHGTYHAAWPRILSTGGLKCMSRNHIHFATGPPLSSILPDGRDGKVVSPAKAFGKGGKEGVISGMRSDAQILIYLDLKRAMEAGCPFWISENGVVLSEGMRVEGSSAEKVVPLEFFDVVVERKNGLGVLWDKGTLVQPTPDWMLNAKSPKRTRDVGGEGRKGGRGNKGPRLKVEKDTDIVDDV